MLVFLTAMESEALALAAQMEEVKKETQFGVDFYDGKCCGKTVAVVKSGVGKVHSAHATLLSIQRYAPEGIVDTGVAGGLGVCKPLDVVAATAFCQHDMDTSPVGDPKGYLSVLDAVYLPTDGKLNELIRKNIPEAKWGVIASGDQFICTDARAAEIRQDFGAIACEMEGGAAAQIAALHGVPYAAFRVISDSGSDGAEVTFQQVLDRAKTLGGELMRRMLQNEEGGR